MSHNADKFAQELRDIPREELLARLHSAFHTAMTMFDEVGDQDWDSFMVVHALHGPVAGILLPHRPAHGLWSS